jgi:hypothetical protein
MVKPRQKTDLNQISQFAEKKEEDLVEELSQQEYFEIELFE